MSSSGQIDELILGESVPIRRLRALVAQVAPTSLPILIEGPTGAGKELVARALHLASGRRGRLVSLNVCALGEGMFEGALFGHVKGAFTGAVSDSPGYLLEAHEGTIFLDEIGELPLGQQAKLLRAIETREFRSVGARQDRRSDFRVVAATNASLKELTAEARFRADLTHRLSGFVLRVPALLERLDDLPLLARHFLAAIPGWSRGELSTDAVETLCDHDWPGNVRELRHVVERAAVLSAPPTLRREAVLEALEVHPPEPGARSMESSRQLRFERRRLLQMLEECGWDTALVATRLDVNRATVYRRMQRLGIVRGVSPRSARAIALPGLPTSDLPSRAQP